MSRDVFQPTGSRWHRFREALWCAYVNIHHWIEEAQTSDREQFYERIAQWQRKDRAA